MSLRLSRRANEIVQSEIRNMSVECERAGGINLSQGVCDTEVPLPVRRGAQRAIDEGINSYTRYDGLSELRKAIGRKLSSYNGIQVDPETQITVSGGSTGAFYCACLALLDPGDEVVLFEPYYGYHVNTLQAVEAKPVLVPMTPPDWTFSRKALADAIGPRTRAIMVNTPANPTGKVFSRAEIEAIGEIAIKHDLIVFTDEIYEYILYDRRKHVSPGSIDAIADRTVTISGYSKTFSITGWRIGYSACRSEWAKTIGYMNDLIYVCAPAPLQAGVARGLDQLTPGYYEELRAGYATKRDKICSALEKIHLPPCVPQGAYYVLFDASRLPGATSKERAMYLLEKTGVATVPGSAFCGEGRGENLLRACFAKSDSDLDEACKRLERLK